MAGGVALATPGCLALSGDWVAPSFEQGRARLSFDPSGHSYEIDSAAAALTFRDREGRLLAQLGVAGRDGCGELNGPVSVASDGAGRVHVVELGNRRVQTLTAAGRHSGFLAQDLERPRDIAMSDDRVAVCDSGRHQVRVFSREGKAVGTIGQQGLRRGELNGPTSVAFAPDGSVHVADQGNARVQAFDRSGRYLFSYGSYGVGKQQFLSPRCIRFDAHGRAWVADAVTRRVSVFDGDGRLLHSLSPVDERGAQATPHWLAVLPNGGIYLALLSA